ncbi:MAG: ABC transporter substrate-binding protein [Lachnospiraceae bacterium]|nr:ABC transporter substrate-binding protein [Lachnospiraceae bacterium]MBQ1640417.1 ABC transporter substrate-binding protein [Lachnospiraceae bacterium]MBQ2532528.1 ABC transporter substrate-binding protein [Lachnospiraceae bacterium]MBQ5387401.1 ABC transporter substrate-binding protein [Lachnospiraceae bacterium]
MKKRLLTGLLCASMLVMSITGCGVDASQQTTADTAGSETEEQTVDEAPEKYTVGVVQLVQHPALDQATEGFQDALRDKLGDQVEFDVQNASGDSANCNTIVNGFVSSEYDLIMANATPALQAAVSGTTTIPVVGTSVTDYAVALDIATEDWTGATGSNATGVSDLAPLDQQAAMMKELFPDAKKVGILYCSAEANSKYQAQVMTEELEKLGYTATSFTFSDTNDVATVTQTACADSDVIYIPTDNTAASCAELIGGVVVPAGVPVLAGEEGICKACGVATLTISYYDVGYLAGEMAYEILVNKADPATMNIKYVDEVKKEYNATLAETFGVEIPSDYAAIKTEE